MTATIEMPTPTPGAILTSLAQTSDQSSLSFSDSLLAASKASSVAEGPNDASPKAARQQGSTADGVKLSSADPSRIAAQPPTHPQQAALPQQVLPAKQALSNNPIFTFKQLSLKEPAAPANESIVESDHPTRDAAAPRLEGAESTIVQPGVIDSDKMQSTVGLRGIGPVESAAMLPGTNTSGIEAPIASSPRTRNNVSNVAETGASNSVRKPIQNVVLSSGTNEVKDLLLKSFMYALPSAEPIPPSNVNLNAIRSVAPTAFSEELQSSIPNVFLNGPSSAVRNDSSAAVSSGFQNALLNTVAIEVHDPLPEGFKDTHLSATPSIPSDATSSAIQNRAPNTGSNEVLDTLPKTSLSAPSGPVSNLPSSAAPNAVQIAVPITDSNEVQNPLSKAAPSVPPSAISSVPSNAAPNAVQIAALYTAPSEIQTPLSNAAPSVPLSSISSRSSNAAPNAVRAASSNTASNEIQLPLSKAAPSVPLSSVSSGPSIAAPNAVQAAGSNTAPNEIQLPLSKAAPSVPLSSISSGPSIAAPNAVQGAAPKIAPTEAQLPPSKEVPSVPLSSISSGPSNAAPNAVRVAGSSTAVNDIQLHLSKAVPSVVRSSVSSVPSDSASNTVQVAAPKTAPNEVQNPLPTAAPSAVPNVLFNADPTPVPVPHVASSGSAIRDNVSASSPTSKVEAAPSAVADLSLFETGLSGLGSTSDQFVALAQLSSVLMGAGRTGALNPEAVGSPSPTTGAIDKGGIKDTSSIGAAQKQHAQPASDGSGSLTGSQSATSSDDQIQHSPSPLGQNVVPAQSNLAAHSVAASSAAQTAGIASSVQNPASLAGTAGHPAKTQDNAAPASTAVPQPLPVINTAKLIQTMGQSEMRVGMRSNEFGNISISTSATRDLISAQISLDHGELARALAAHLPEMQARLGSNQAMDVRIDMHGNGTGQGTGTPGGATNGSADQSRQGRQQSGNSGSAYAGGSFAERQFSPVASAMTTGDGRLNARLDIRV